MAERNEINITVFNKDGSIRHEFATVHRKGAGERLSEFLLEFDRRDLLTGPIEPGYMRWDHRDTKTKAIEWTEREIE